MTWNELRRLAVRKGWLFLRHGGKHDVYVKEGKKILIERHWSQEVRYGMLLKLLYIINNE
ncbi:MAG: type II toxin-antitoxin system HicA family toxin [Bacteroidales bacterium]|nr:type II toxin-antitoxin system HicA family toxin [Bacteroidales bacterium]